MADTHPGVTNYTVDVPGTSVTCRMAVTVSRPTVWIYTLWDNDDRNDYLGTFLAQGEMDLAGLPDVRPDQVARVAFLLELEYPTVHDLRGPSGAEHNVGPW